MQLTPLYDGETHMTKKHFEAIAAILNSFYIVPRGVPSRALEAAAVSGIAEEMADLFAQENPRFDRARFLKACGVEE